MIEKKRVIDFVKTGENTNIVKLSSTYGSNCKEPVHIEYDVRLFGKFLRRLG